MSSIVPNRNEALSPVDEGLSDAFGGSDASFSETMTDIIETVSKSIKKKDQSQAGSSAMNIDLSTMSGTGGGGSLLGSPKTLGMGAAALVVVAGLGFWWFGGFDEAVVEETTPEAVAETPLAEEPATTDSIFATEVVVPQAMSVDDYIDEAQLAARAGQIFNPPGSNAIELYLSALEVAPGDPVAEHGLGEIILQALGMVETALLERRADDALAALQRIELADAENARLPFLNAQLTQMQLRDFVDAARAAIRESRFEDAQIAINAASSLAVADTTEIDAVADQLSAALSDQRIDEVLAQANARLDEGNLTTPSNDNARYYFERVLSSDPNNAAARQGLATVASELVLQARAQIDEGNFDNADTLLADARRLDPSSSALVASTAALSNARSLRKQEIRAASERAAAERAAAARAADERVAAEKAAAEKLAADNAAAERAAEQQAAAEQLAAEQLAAEQLAADAVVEQPVEETPASDSGVDESAVATFAVAGAGDTIEASISTGRKRSVTLVCSGG